VLYSSSRPVLFLSLWAVTSILSSFLLCVSVVFSRFGVSAFKYDLYQYAPNTCLEC
jgi:hypothetical protein